MYQAVLSAKVQFIQLFIEQGVILKEWLTPKVLHELYVKSVSRATDGDQDPRLFSDNFCTQI